MCDNFYKKRCTEESDRVCNDIINFSVTRSISGKNEWKLFEGFNKRIEEK